MGAKPWPMAAKRFAPGERILDLRSADQADVEGYEVHSRKPGMAAERGVLTDAPPSPYVERLGGASGEVRVAPMVDALLRKLRLQRHGPKP